MHSSIQAKTTQYYRYNYPYDICRAEIYALQRTIQHSTPKLFVLIFI